MSIAKVEDDFLAISG